ncbi:hypothetical protein F4861DRAFT_509744 [Xylaria intraflava]|nr:hypothetical protein F4861DRAFT_509744 [Xylaria intraflava]
MTEGKKDENMSTAIIKSIIEFDAGETLDKIEDLIYKPDTTVIDAILGGFDSLETLVKTLDYQNKLWVPMIKIYYWVDRIQKTVDDREALDDAAHREAYNKVIAALKSEYDGVRYQTLSLFNVLMKDKSPIATEGLLTYWESEAYQKLSNRNNTSYHVQDYINELDTNISAVAALLHHGMELSMYIAPTAGYAEAFRREAEDRVNTFRNTLYNKLYPPVLRQLKSSYGDAGKYLTDGRWFSLYSENSNQDFLTIYPKFVRSVSLFSRSRQRAVKMRTFRTMNPRSFRFVASDRGKLLGPLEMHAFWLDGSASRVKCFSGVVDGSHWTIAYTNSTRPETSDILFKLIPVHVEGETSAKPVKLIPYSESTGIITRDDQVNTWSATWRLEQTLWLQ